MVQKSLHSVVFVFIVLVLLVGIFLVGRSFAERRVSYAQGGDIPAAPADPNFSSFACTNVSNVVAIAAMPLGKTAAASAPSHKVNRSSSTSRSGLFNRL